MENLNDKSAVDEISVNEGMDSNFKNDSDDDNSFMELFEKSLENIQEGKIVKGEILQIDKEFVLIDIGYKSEGQVRITEFIDSEGRITAKIGDKVEVLLVRKEDKEGRIILSKQKAAGVKIWDNVEKTFRNNGTIRGKIVSQVKGGLFVDIGIQAFLPGSQVDIRPVHNLASLIGIEYDFKILKFEKRQGNIVLSRRAVLEVEQKALREETLKILEKDTTIEGIVSNITDYGVFIDLGGINGLVHITDISWGKAGHPSELYRIGDRIKVKVLSFNEEKTRVSLGIKQLTTDPWEDAQDKYPIGAKIKGRVEGLKEYGAFVEIEQGISGLIHLSEISWTGRIKHPSQMISVGDLIDVIILSVDVHKKRISLSMKQVEPNPWEQITKDYPIGAIIEGEIINITDFGLFIGIAKGIDGLVHISDISWTKKINHPSDLYQTGDAIKAVILEIDTENERFSLGIKQLQPDPWDIIHEKYSVGSRISGIVKGITDFGIFVEIEEGIEGLIHISQIPNGVRGKIMEEFKVNDEIEAEVINLSQDEKKIGLSIRKLEESREREEYGSHINNNKQATSNLGEMLREKMMKL